MASVVHPRPPFPLLFSSDLDGSIGKEVTLNWGSTMNLACLFCPFARGFSEIFSCSQLWGVGREGGEGRGGGAPTPEGAKSYGHAGGSERGRLPPDEVGPTFEYNTSIFGTKI